MSSLKEIKDAARQAFRDQQTQDTEGGAPDIVSFVAGFVAGARHQKQTHIESFLEMLISIGYSGEVLQEKGKFGVSISSNGDKVHGYMGFVAHFEFNPDGSLNNVGIYE